MAVPPSGLAGIEVKEERPATMIDAILCAPHATEKCLGVVIIHALAVGILFRVADRIVLMLSR